MRLLISYSGTCTNCRRHLRFFNLKYYCDFCGDTLCRNCVNIFDCNATQEIIAFKQLTSEYPMEGEHVYSCHSCLSTFDERVETLAQNAIMIGGKENVRLYSQRYQGRLPKHKEETHIKTGFYRDRNNAEEELKNIAAHLGCRNVINVRYNRDTNEDGNYKFSVFQYEGIGIK